MSEHVCPHGYDPAVHHDCRHDHSSKIHFLYQYADCPGCTHTAEYLAQPDAPANAGARAGSDLRGNESQTAWSVTFLGDASTREGEEVRGETVRDHGRAPFDISDLHAHGELI